MIINEFIKNITFLAVAARNCSRFAGPTFKAEFKSEMLEVLRINNKFRSTLKKLAPINENANYKEIEGEIRRLEALKTEAVDGSKDRNKDDEDLLRKEADDEQDPWIITTLKWLYTFRV